MYDENLYVLLSARIDNESTYYIYSFKKDTLGYYYTEIQHIDISSMDNPVHFYHPYTMGLFLKSKDGIAYSNYDWSSDLVKIDDIRCDFGSICKYSYENKLLSKSRGEDHFSFNMSYPNSFGIKKSDSVEAPSLSQVRLTRSNWYIHGFVFVESIADESDYHNLTIYTVDLSDQLDLYKVELRAEGNVNKFLTDVYLTDSLLILKFRDTLVNTNIVHIYL